MKMKKMKKMMAVLLGLSLVTAMSAGPAFAADKMPAFENNKQMVEYFWNQVFNKHNTSVIDSMTAPNYIQHSPGFADGRQAFEDGIQGFLKEFPESKAVIKQPYYAECFGPGAGGSRYFPCQRWKNRRALGRYPGYSGKSRK